jgi:hypothetical protein
MAGERSLASGPGESGSEPKWRALSRAMPARRAASVLGGATGVSAWAGAAGGADGAAGGVAGCWANVDELKMQTLAAKASTPNFCRSDMN